MGGYMQIEKKYWQRLCAVTLLVMLVLQIFGEKWNFLTMESKAEKYEAGATLQSPELSYGESWDLHCIDSWKLLGDHGGILGGHEQYQAFTPSAKLSESDTATLFWAAMSFYAGSGDRGALSVIETINANAASFGITPVTKSVTAEDLKGILHSSKIRGKHPWIASAAANGDKYLQAAGVVASGKEASAQTSGLKSIPSVLQGHDIASNPLDISKSNYTITFSSEDAEFISRCPIKFKQTDGSYSAIPTGGWKINKTQTSVTFMNENLTPPKAEIIFDAMGTPFASMSGGYQSAKEVYNSWMLVWFCVGCNNVHSSRERTQPLGNHQRHITLEILAAPGADKSGSSYYYISTGGGDSGIGAGGGSGSGSGSGGSGSGASASMVFHIYRHEEDYLSTYNVQLTKYDHETGKTLEGAVFDVFERFDDKDQINITRDGAKELYEKKNQIYQGGYNDIPVIWNGFRKIGSVVTDGNGYASHTQNHSYHYDKTFCDGHPSPVFVEVPEPEEDEETGEIENEAEIEAAKAENKRIAILWISTKESCEAKAMGADQFDGVHFHWLNNAVYESVIQDIAISGGEEGSTPDGGVTESADGDTSYANSGCQTDNENSYAKFISLHYSYTFAETKARVGYILHDTHPDDVPIEIITTDSSENGANSCWGPNYKNPEKYSYEIVVNDDLPCSSLYSTLQNKEQNSLDSCTEQLTPAEEHRQYQSIILPFVTECIQEIYELFVKEEDTEIEDTEIEDADLEDTDLKDTKLKYAETSTSSNVSKASFSDASIDAEKTHNERLLTGHGPLARIATLADMERRSESNILDGTYEQSDQLFLKTIQSERENKNIGNIRYISYDQDGIFAGTYAEGLISGSVGITNTPGSSERWSHCNDMDGEGNMWRIYDHRTEGEIHMNKRDYRLDEAAKKGNVNYKSAYGEAQGDGTLEGAVYGLFAAENIEHPDGKTGIVYERNDLVATAVTDRNGDASFFAYTQPPGKTYCYEDGRIKFKGSFTGPMDGNLYQEDSMYDDYTESSLWETYTNLKERTYSDFHSENGNCWIGRPLILGTYYIKELSRSEGYELSIGEKEHPITNRSQDPEASVDSEKGFAAIVTAPYGEGQLSGEPTGEYGAADTDEIFFDAISKNTGAEGFDIVISGVPSGCRFERLDTGTKSMLVEVGTGEYEEVFETDAAGNPIYVIAPNDYTYPKFNSDGTYKQVEMITNLTKKQIPYYGLMKLDDSDGGIIEKSLKAALDEMTVAEVSDKLRNIFDLSQEKDRNFVKAKLEMALRKNSYLVPYDDVNGVKKYSTLSYSAYNKGMEKGSIENNYGYPVQTINIKKADLTCGDLINTLLHYYQEHPYYNFGGIDRIEDSGNTYAVTLYTGRTASENGFFVSIGSENVFFLPIKGKRDNLSDYPRIVYAIYTKDGMDLLDGTAAFGYYTADSYESLDNRIEAEATFVTAADIDGDGNLLSKKFMENEYYLTGEIPYGADGRPIQKSAFIEKTKTILQTVEDNHWTPVTCITEENNRLIVHVDGSYSDEYGIVHNDDITEQEYSFRIVLPEKNIVLTEKDMSVLGMKSGWNIGDRMSAAIYYTTVKNTFAKAYRNYEKLRSGGTGYIEMVSLTYPGQNYVFQDGDSLPMEGTIKVPVRVTERPIRQKIRVNKDIGTLKEYKEVWYCLNCGYENGDSILSCDFCGDQRTTEDTRIISYDHDTYTAVHSHNIDVSEENDESLFNYCMDWLTDLLQGRITNENSAKIPDFVFKAYLKSNLEQLYRKDDENNKGMIVWTDRNGNTMTPQYTDTNGDGNYDTFTWKYDRAFEESILDFPERDTAYLQEKSIFNAANVEKIYTQVDHNMDSKTCGSRNNNVWSVYDTPQKGNEKGVALIDTYVSSEREDLMDGVAVHSNTALYSYQGKNINVGETECIRNTDYPNTGYTRILEMCPVFVEDGTETKRIETYNYEKFFDAINAANMDRWDNDMYSTFHGNYMENDPGQHWMDTFYQKFQKNDADTDGFHSRFEVGSERIDKKDADGTVGGDTSTSFKPFRWIKEKTYGEPVDYANYPAVLNGIYLENTEHTSEFAKANANASDAVRQFAEKWYLKDEVAKLVKDNGNKEDIAKTEMEGGVSECTVDGEIPYNEAVYDQALFEAIAKSYHYLLPFYTYDLDTIYSVEWDSAENGGKDHDFTTLSADNPGTNSYYGISAYLPYGTYVICEQTPMRRDSDVNESRNRSFGVDSVKEVSVPTVYDGPKANSKADNYNDHYKYDSSMKLFEQAKSANYNIRFGEEWNLVTGNQDLREYVIHAHNGYGDYEIYPYGLDVDKVSGSVEDEKEIHSYRGYTIKQEMYDPLKDVYDDNHNGEENVFKIGKELGGNEYCLYMSDSVFNENGKSTVKIGGDGTLFHERYYYGSISEDQGKKENVLSMTGVLTAYDNCYAPVLVPWSVVEPGNPEIYSAAGFYGYADVNMHNRLYSARLKVNKTDSETGEYILHDDAIFAIYAGSRYVSYEEIQKDAAMIRDAEEKERFLHQFKPGDAKFYLQETKISGTKEFLEAMGAHDLVPYAKGKSAVKGIGMTYIGTVPKGTPICKEEERIDLLDMVGNRTGQMTVYTTNADVNVTDEENESRKHYANQNVGYFITPQSLGAGVYVLAEIKAPYGYARSKPIAYELYGDAATYYADGDMYAKVKAVRKWENVRD